MSEDQANKKVFRLPKDLESGMTVDRALEIEEAEKAGTPIEVTEEERAELEEMRRSIRASLAGPRNSLTGDYKSMFDRLSGVSGISAFATKADMMPGIARAMQASSDRMANHGGITQEHLDGIAQAKREEHEREERNSENIKVTTEVMQDMLASMSEQALMAAERDEEAKTSAKRNHRVAVGSMIFAALALIAPFVIETIKGWQ